MGVASVRTPALLLYFTHVVHTWEPPHLPFGHPRPPTSSDRIHAGPHAHSPLLPVPGACTASQQLPFHAPRTADAVPLPLSPSASHVHA